MLGFLTRYSSMRVVLVLMACVVSRGAGAANPDEPVVTVMPLLLIEPSVEETTTELSSMGVPLTEPGDLIPGDKVYLEIWFQTVGPNGIASAVLNISYETAFLDTSVEQITLASLWMDLFAPFRVVDDAVGFITDVGGISVSGQGLEPHWAKLATIEFDVIVTPDTRITACTHDGGPKRGFGMLGIGAVEKVDYRCTGCAEGVPGCCSSDDQCPPDPKCFDSFCDLATNSCELSDKFPGCCTSQAQCTGCEDCVNNACVDSQARCVGCEDCVNAVCVDSQAKCTGCQDCVAAACVPDNSKCGKCETCDASGQCNKDAPDCCTSDAQCPPDPTCFYSFCDLTTNTCAMSPLPDADGDGVCDLIDNCVTVPNGPALGTCIVGIIGTCLQDGDCDTFGVVAGFGVCSLNQEDTNGDGYGDVCSVDCDHDGDVDLVDYDAFEQCLTGPGLSSVVAPCLKCFDFDGDTDIDLFDFYAFQLTFARGVHNDNCENAVGPLVVPSTIGGSTVLATIDDTFPYCGTSITAPGVWYTATGTGNLMYASTCDYADYDTKISVYCPDCDVPVCVGGNDDTCGLQSEVVWCSETGQTYLILVHGYGGETGSFNLTVWDED